MLLSLVPTLSNMPSQVPDNLKDIGTYVHTSKTDGGDGEVISEPDYVHELDLKKEKALVRKFDLRILPVLAVMYLFNALDKSNLCTTSMIGEHDSEYL